MTESPNSTWTDDQIIQCIHHWAVEAGNVGLDADRYNEINDKYFVPCAEILKARGAASLAKLLPLLEDGNPEVRLTAAGIAYEADIPRCRKVLENLMKTPDRIGLLAWATVAAKEPGNAPKPSELWGNRL
jgi:hypothetical protein